MTEAVVLLGYAVLVGWGGAVALRRARWPEQAPGLGVAAWQSLSASVFGSLLLAGLTLTIPEAIVSGSLADWLHACAMAIRAEYATPGGAALGAVGGAATVALFARAGYLICSSLVGARGVRNRHLADLRLAGRRDADLGVVVVEHPAAVAYCLPGRARTVVFTSAAMATLDGEEKAAVLGHELAHLRGHHHLVLAVAEAFARTVPWLPVFSMARLEQGRLLEMLADDAAARRGGRLPVARALVRLAEGSAPPGAGPAPRAALGAADVAALARVTRLVGPAACVGAARRVMIAAALVVSLGLPVAVAVAPAMAARQWRTCPIPDM